MTTTLPFLLRRAATQAVVLVAVTAVVVVGAVLAGTCALLLTTGQESALDAALRRADPRDVAVEVTFRVRGADPADLVDDASQVLADVLEPVHPVRSTWLTSHVRPLTVTGAPDAHGYVVSAEGLSEHADLVTGRWPDAGAGPRLEVAVPVAVAHRLDLTPGSELVLEELRDGTVREPRPGSAAVRLVVVGTFTPTVDESGTWERDVLRGAGVDPTWELPTMMPQPPVTAYGPFAAAPEALTRSVVEVDRVSLLARPDLAGTGADEREAVRRALGHAVRDLRAVVTDPMAQVRVRTDLVRTVTAAETQERVTGSVILAVALLGTALAAAAVGLVGRLLTARRGTEARLLAARGADRRQLVTLAAVESLALALVAAAVAVPAARTLFGWLTDLRAVDVGPAAQVGTPAALVLTVLAGALALAGVLVAPWVRPPDHRPRVRRSVRGRVARTSVDVLLVVLAVVGYLQLRGRSFSAGGGADPVLVAVPVLLLLAGAAVALRVVPWVSRRAEAGARRSPRLVLPLASWEVARRGHSTGAALLLVLAAAGATFGTSLGATWATSAGDQADARVGTELAVGLTAAAPPLAQGRALTALTGADVVPVTDREVSLGPAGTAETAVPETRLLALDTTRPELVRGRLPAGSTWSGLTAGLGPDAPVDGIALPAGADGVRLTVSGTATGPDDAQLRGLTVVPTVVVQAPGGARHALEGWVLPLDGRPHEVELPLPVAGEGEATGVVQVVAVTTRFGIGDADAVRLTSEPAPLEITARVAASGSDEPVVVPAGDWSGVVPETGRDSLDGPREVAVAEDGAGVRVHAAGSLLVAALMAGDADLVLTGFAPPEELPVLVSGALARAVAAEVGDALSLDVGATALAARVVAVAPDGVAVPRGADLLVDHDALSRAALAHGSSVGLTDGWWVAGSADPAATATRIAAAGLGEPVTREGLAAELRGDPLRSGVQLALWLLVAAAVVLAVAGTAAQTVAALEARAVDVARLQGMGVPRRSLVAALLVEHGAVSLLVVAAGGLVGAVAAVTAGPLLVVSPSGRAPVPAAVPVWSWPTQSALLVALVVSCAAVMVPVAVTLVRRATATHLRMEGGG